MKRSACLFSFFAFLFCITLPALSQEEITLILRSGEELEGEIVGIIDDSITFTHSYKTAYPNDAVHTQTLRVPRTDIQRIEIGKGGSFGGDVLTGLGIGAGIGVITGVLVASGEDGPLAGLAGMAAFGVSSSTGLLIGIIAGAATDHSTQTFHPAMERDYKILAAHFEDGASSRDTSSSIQSTYSFAQDSLPQVLISMKDGSSFICYLLDVRNDGVVVLTDDWSMRMKNGNATEIFVPFEQSTNIRSDNGGGWEIGTILGGLVAPIIFRGPNPSQVLGEVAGGALLGGMISYLMTLNSRSKWEWNPNAGDPNFLRRYALCGRVPDVASYAPSHAGSSNP
jgi:hypothetical protein